MEKSKVYKIKDEEKIADMVGNIFNFNKEEEVLVKLHFGENYNKNHLRPKIAKEVVDFVKSKGGKPILFDTNVAYNSPRHTTQGHLKTAKENGFDFCEIKIGEKSKKDKDLELSEDFLNAKNIIVLSHFKGHCDAGFGGAIKNLGMGVASVNQKIKTHDYSSPVFYPEKCTDCGLCIKSCHVSAISKLKKGVKIDYEDCHGCGICAKKCSSKALEVKKEYLTNSLINIAKVSIKNKNVVFINVLEKITKKCDCCGESEIVCPDLGILISEDIVAIEKASIDLINKKTGKDLFLELNNISPDEQINEAEKLNLGNKNYELIER